MQQVEAHHYAWGDVEDLDVLDRMMEGLAQGGVMATRVWLANTSKASRVEFAFTGWRPTPPAYARDPRCQSVSIGPLAGGIASCLDLAIYHAAWLQTFGGLWNRAWVVLLRESSDSYAHAVVGIFAEDGSQVSYEDPSQLWKGSTS